jgi:hypothetical protein
MRARFPELLAFLRDLVAEYGAGALILNIRVSK